MSPPTAAAKTMFEASSGIQMMTLELSTDDPSRRQRRQRHEYAEAIDCQRAELKNDRIHRSVSRTD